MLRQVMDIGWERAAIRILVVEDDRGIAGRLATGLADHGFVVELAHDGEDGHALGCSDDFDAVILDLGLPGLSGLEVLRRWRKAGRHMPVLVLTARGGWDEKVEGLNAGADDYITKPFHIPEVAARLRALMRRSSGTSSPVLSHGDLELDPTAGTVTQNGQPVDLTAQEFRLLSYFMHRRGRVIPQSELLDHLYTLDDARDSNTIEVYVGRLRRKLGRDVIRTLRGLGYRLG